MRDAWLTVRVELGPGLCALGIAAALLGAWVHVVLGKPTIFRTDDGPPRAPSTWERISVHLVVYAAWAVGFGGIVWRGVPRGMVDTRFIFERQWPVFQSSEWLYLSVYVVPFFMPWLASDRAALRRYALNLWSLLLISVAFYLTLPFGSPPRGFIPDSWAGSILAWETSRADFAAAALPSFHVLWALLCASLLGTRSKAWAWAGRLWALAAGGACIANGAHAVADVATSVVIYALLVRFGPVTRATMKPASRPSTSAPAP